jgi:paraquat-inducible protein A
MIYLLVPLRFCRLPYRFDVVFRLLQLARPWGMTEVLILGMLVALVKLAHIASVVPGTALWTFGVLMVLLAAASGAFDPREFWERTRAAQAAGADTVDSLAPHARTAMGCGLLTCHTCEQLVKSSTHSDEAVCPRCGAHLHARKPNSIGRTWAFLIAAIVLYIPANALPVMNTSSLFGSEKDTILSGVVYLWTSGSWPLAVIVFIASIAVPMLKIIALMFLVVSTQFGSAWSPQQRARIYRVVELVGRWSMLDIYVITILVALVQFKGLATIQAGPAAIAFGSVVVLTMFAALAFDPRLIWDRAENNHVQAAR